MPRVLVFDSFPVSCAGKKKSDPPTVTDDCRDWIMDCVAAAGNVVYVPGIAYYETLRELERLGATAQIARLKTFCFAGPAHFLPLDTRDLEEAAKLWAQSRRIGRPTSGDEALDGDMILCAQVLSLNLPPTEYVVATTNTKHLTPFVNAEECKKSCLKLRAVTGWRRGGGGG